MAKTEKTTGLYSGVAGPDDGLVAKLAVDLYRRSDELGFSRDDFDRRSMRAIVVAVRDALSFILLSLSAGVTAGCCEQSVSNEDAIAVHSTLV